MKVVIAIDSFKGSLTSLEAGLFAKEGIKRVYPDSDIQIVPIADGGEGTVQSLSQSMGGQIVKASVKNPLGESITAEYGIVNDTAIIEMAAASGIALISKDKLNPMETTTYGVGEMIKDAIEKNCRDFIIGIGGSATNDGGTGMLMALGFEFLDENQKPIGYGAKELSRIKYVSDKNVIKELKECTFNIACDVINPLCGENGCSAVFAPQKGAKSEDIKAMDDGMKNYAQITLKKYDSADMNFPGAGAAGGLGFAFMAYLGGKLKSGIELILEKTDIEKYIKDADIVITGEGRIDSQTVMGKTPIGVARLAKKHKKPVIAFCGCASDDANVCNAHGIDAIFPIIRGATSLEDAMNKKNASSNMSDCVEQVMHLIKLFK